MSQETEDAELLALTAIVNRQTAIIECETRRYGELTFDPWTEELRILTGMLTARGVIPLPIPPLPTASEVSDGE